jgi:predicted TIM-barrel fold metal-dependent hydrolase
MYDDLFVFEGVAHAYDFSDANRVDSYEFERYDLTRLYFLLGAHGPLESMEPGFQLTVEECSSRWPAEAVAHALFVESDVDMCAYHHVDMPGICKEGVSRWDTGVELARMAPNRVLLYGGVDVFNPDRGKVFAEMERQAAEGAVGFKFYPSTMFEFTGRKERLPAIFYNDPDRAYPFFEKARELGVSHLAFHKAQPVGPGVVEASRPGDLTDAALDFPDMTFEVVHDGFAFLEECALQLGTTPNIYANLEVTLNWVVRQPRRFAEAIGTLLGYGGPQRLLFATGCILTHTDPVIRAFMDFEMPRDLVEGWGMPELTPEIKRAILGENMAALHGIDTAERRALLANDEWSKLRAAGKEGPWATRRRLLAEHPETVQRCHAHEAMMAGAGAQ